MFVISNRQQEEEQQQESSASLACPQSVKGHRLMMMGQLSTSNRKQLQHLLTLFALVTIIVSQCWLVPTVSARYLPTRSNIDQSRRQQIKEVLRLLLDIDNDDNSPMEPTGSLGRASYGLGGGRGLAGNDFGYELSPYRMIRAVSNSEGMIQGSQPLVSGNGRSATSATNDQRTKRNTVI